jgi:hypothetical protein
LSSEAFGFFDAGSRFDWPHFALTFFFESFIFAVDLLLTGCTGRIRSRQFGTNDISILDFLELCSDIWMF